MFPGNVYTGTAPADCFFKLTDSTGNPLLVVPLSTAALRTGPTMMIGGSGKLILGRNADDASQFILRLPGGHHVMSAGNSLRLAGDGTTTYKVDVNYTGVAFQGTNAIAKPTITGAKGGNAALASIATQGAAYGLWVDGTT